MKFETKAIHKGQKPDKAYGAMSSPIYMTSTFKQDGFAEYEYDYSRADNPTRHNLEENMTSLEEGVGACSFGSGMAAISAILSLLSKDDHIIVSENVYGGTYRVIANFFNKFGISASWVDTTKIENIKNAITPQTKMVFAETPSNPMMILSDISAISNLCKSKGIISVFDNTFLSPYFQRPLTLGGDIVIHSTTKYLNGHSDLVGGIVITSDSQLLERLKFIQMSVGGVPSPFDVWLTQRSIKTLAVRMKSHNKNAMKLAVILENSPKINTVFYAGLPSHPQHELAKIQQLDPHGNPGFGGIISIETGSLENATKFVKSLNVFTLAESLGGVESLVCHPATMTHASIPEKMRLKLGVTNGLVRLSVGIEHIDDLIQDIENGINSLQ
jgi:cystathionine beta-lyase/cystathionine gamma-synthase